MNTAATNPALENIRLARETLAKKIIGQEHLIERLMIALLCGGHLLVEGAPGLAKTRAIKELANVIEGDFQRIQFTPDLLPSDVTGTEIYRPETGEFKFQSGPIFNNLILADEINRAPAKVQSALLEAMAEHQVSVGNQTYTLDDLFLVMATQNPIEQEGTYPLPEAQLDRFLMHVEVAYPSAAAELAILNLVRNEGLQPANSELSGPATITRESIFSARQAILGMHMEHAVEDYVVALVMATRQPPEALESWIEYGASPRATISLDQCARAHAWLAGRDFVAPQDVAQVAPDVLRHRLILSFDAQAQGVTTHQVIDTLLSAVPTP